MTQFSFNRRVIGTMLAGALVVTTALPAAAQRIPMAKEFFEPLADQVAYKRKRRGGNQAVGAAVLLGVIGLGVAAAAASNRRSRDRDYYYQPQYGQGYAPQYYGQGYAPQYDRQGYAPQYYGNGYAPVYQQPQVYRAPRVYQQPQPQVYYHQQAPQVYRQPRRQAVPTGAPQGGYYDGQGGYVYGTRGGVNRVIVDNPQSVPGPTWQNAPGSMR